jgi:DNA-binding NtrC family response regulator
MANAAKSAQLKVLYCEGNAEVLASQAECIQGAGHNVETALGRKAVEQALRQATYDLVVLGPTLTKNDRHHLPYMVKKANEGTRVLVMHTDGERHPAVDANLDTGRSIQDVVAKIAAMWSKTEVAKTAGAGR